MPRLLAVLACCCLSLPALVGQSFMFKHISYEGSGDQGLHELSVLPNGNLLLYGHHFARGNNAVNGGSLMTFDPSGDLVGPALKITNTRAQIKEVITRQDGSSLLLGNYLDPTDFFPRFGFIHRDAGGEVTRSQAWIGDVDAVAENAAGEVVFVGSQSDHIGLYGKLNAAGEIEFLRELSTTTPRPAGLQGVVPLRNGDFLAFGQVTTTIDGVPQAEIMLMRFTPAGEVVWSEKVSRGRFYAADQNTMNLRQPTRLQLDAEENIYLMTFLGSGGQNWRTHLLKLDPEGRVLYSNAYETDGQFAGQGTSYVHPDGRVMLAFQAITSRTERSLTALAINPDGSVRGGVRTNGRLYDVSGLQYLPGRERYLITGTTFACESEERLTYLAELDADLHFGDAACESERVSYRSSPVPVETLPLEFTFGEVAQEPALAFELGEHPVTVTSVGCLTFEPVVPQVATFGCGQAPDFLPILVGAGVTDEGDNIRSIDLRVVEGAAGVRLDYPDRFDDLVTRSSPTQITLTNPGEFGGIPLDSLLVSLQLTADIPAALIGRHEIEIVVRGNCGAEIREAFTLELVEVTEPPEVAIGRRIFSFCEGDDVRIRPSAGPPAHYEWSDGTLGPELAPTEPGVYQLIVFNACGRDSANFLLERFQGDLLRGLDTTLLLCPGGEVTYDPQVDNEALTLVQWGGETGEPVRTFTNPGNYRLTLANNCSFAQQLVSVQLLDNSDRSPTTEVAALQCAPGDTVLLRPTLIPGDALVWEDGTTATAFPATEAGRYTATISNSCGTYETIFEVTLAAGGQLADESVTLVMCYGDSVPFSPAALPGVALAWVDAFPVPERVFTEAGNYELLRTNGCVSASTEVEVKAQDCCAVYLPTAFSPNQDGVNDTYQPLLAREGCEAIAEVEFRIFDRWGGLVHDARDLSPWTGRQNGDRYTSGTYLAVLRYWNGNRHVVMRREVVVW